MEAVFTIEATVSLSHKALFMFVISVNTNKLWGDKSVDPRVLCLLPEEALCL